MEEEAALAAATTAVSASTAAMLLLSGHSTSHHHHHHQQHQHDFKWTHERCLLLLHEYDLLKDKFKDRKHKKKDLWAEISMKFKKIYAYDLEWDVAYKKFRNLKQTFEQVRAKMQQQAITGQISNRPKWAYFEKFQQILDDPGIPAYSYGDPAAAVHHHKHEEQEEQEDHHHHHHQHHNARHDHHIHQHHDHHAGQQHVVHAHLDPATVGQVLAAGEDFTDTLVTVFPMGEEEEEEQELEIPSQPVEESGEEEEAAAAASASKVEQVEEQLQEVEEEEEPVLLEEAAEEEELTVEQQQHHHQQQLDETEEAPHRKRFRRLNDYEQERLLIEREKLVTLREIQRGIECKNDILRGILHVLQSRVWQAHATE
ncbi:LIM domain-containing protein A [Anopheles gambiae]|uniref:MADF domain-containing protein n=1 Tax=Anopheles coluzzii TaxID=1518534 RepID=A0A6E8VPX7_ANOCL|nr:LIM domain-containing protein A-like [Anopheles coluzzii]XP_557111.2 LIM domain-containing protein A [Anopheles gambiae]